MAVGSLGRLHSRGKNMQKDIEINVFGLPLASCSQEPLTGYFRDGSCNTCAQDTGSHTVCGVMTSEFLAFSKYLGNDLTTPGQSLALRASKPGTVGAFVRDGFYKPTRRAVHRRCNWRRPIKRRWTSFRLKSCNSMRRPNSPEKRSGACAACSPS